MKKINVKGVIVPNDYKGVYDYIGIEATCPNDVIEQLDGDVEVHINSPGGVVSAGSEIYTALRAHTGDVKIYIVGQACSAASVIAMAGYCEMSPTAIMMVHCASTYAEGNHTDMNKASEILSEIDKTIANAYMAKANMSLEEALDMMEKETWLTPDKAKELGLIDAIMFEDVQAAASSFMLPSAEKLEQIKALMFDEPNERTLGVAQIEEGMIANPEQIDILPAQPDRAAILMAKNNLLKLKGEMLHE